MKHSRTILSGLALATFATAQGGDLLYTTSQNERTLSSSGGTVLQNIYPNDVVGLPAFPCPGSAEKWQPRDSFMTMAGDEDGDDNYFEPALMGSIDALLALPTSGTPIMNGRTIWYSPSVNLGSAIAGAPSLRPGDIGRIVRNTSGDGRVQYFIRREMINQALGLPLTTAIDVDAAAFGPNFGLYLSLDTDIACNPCGGPTVMRDGDVFCIPPGAYTMTAAGTLGGVLANSAVRVYTEAQMDLFVMNAMVTDRNGMCVTTAIDTESLEIDWNNPSSLVIPGCTGTAVFVPSLLFTTETLTGGAILTTAFGGQIAPGTCGPLGTSCGFGPTLGLQIGLRPPTASLGIPSYVNALASSRNFTYTAEAQVHQIPVGGTPVIDFNTPGFMGWAFLTFAPMGPAVVAPSAPFIWGMLGHPDYYPLPNFVNTVPGGFATLVGPVVPFPCDLVFQGVTITTAGTIEASTPTMVEVF